MDYEVLYGGSDRQEWLKARKTGIGASDVPVVLGLSPWSTPIKLWAEKRGEAERVRETQSMRDGTALEPIIGDALVGDVDFIKEFGERIWASDQRLLQSKNYRFMLNTPDGWAMKAPGDHQKALLGQLKSTNAISFGKQWEDGNLPAHVEAQVQAEMFVTGEKEAVVCVWAYGKPKLWFHLERNDAFLEQDVLPACEKFWGCVQANEIPEVHEGDDSKIFERLYKVEPGKSIVLPGELLAVDQEIVTISAEMKDLNKQVNALKKRKKTAEARIFAAMKTAELGTFANGSIFRAKDISVKERINAAYSYRRLYRKEK